MKKQAWLPLFAGFGWLLVNSNGLYAFVTNQSADVLIGHHYFSQSGSNRNDPDKNALWYPEAAYYDGTRMYIADSQNNRVLIYNSLPTSFDAAADVVIGQPDMFCNKANQGGNPGPNTLWYPGGVYVYGSILLISDLNNNRVLIFNTIPTQNNASANLVIGQQDFTHNDIDQGGNVAANTLDHPRGICSSGSMLFLADAGSNRVLKYNSIPTFNNINADYVIGQPNKTSFGENNPSLGANSLYGPRGIWVAGSKLFIADYRNSRILIFNDVNAITSDGYSANVVLGQPDFVHNNYDQGLANCTSQTLDWPSGVCSNGTQLLVADQDNHRVLIFNTIPTVNDTAADYVIGQQYMTGSDINQTYSHPTSYTLWEAQNVFVAGSKIFIPDTQNNRLLLYHSIPGENTHPADLVVGQQDMNMGNSNRYAVSEKSLSGPIWCGKFGEKYYVSDQNNNRILVYDSLAAAGSETGASLVIGQSTMQNNAANRGGYVSTADNALNNPQGLCQMAGKLIAADNGNNRVLIYDLATLAANPKAGVVIGQPNMTGNDDNQGGGVGPQTLYSPVGVAGNGGKLFIADAYNNRVLIFNNLPGANNASANIVIGQPNLTSNIGNNGGLGANTLSQPMEVAFTADAKMLISDKGNSRVLIFNSVPAANNAAADVVIGQANISSGQTNQGNAYAGANTCSAPSGLSIFDQKLYIADSLNNRVLIYNTVPTVNNAAADVVIGQSTMSGNSSNQNSWPHPNTISFPRGLYCDASGLFVADYSNHRVLAFLNTPTPTPVPPTPTATRDIAYKNEIRAWNSRFNPEKGEKTYIRWHQAETAGTTVKVFNLRGELVKILQDNVMCSAGQLHELIWDGLNTSGSTVASGIYIIYIDAGRYQDKIKIAVIK